MALRTEFNPGVFYQVITIPRMSRMATAAKPVFKRKVKVTSLKPSHHPLMTGETEFLLLLDEDVLVRTSMGIMTLDTLSTGHRIVNIGLVEFILLFLVALITEVSRSLGRQFGEVAGMSIVATVAIALGKGGMNDFFLQPVFFFLMAVVADFLLRREKEDLFR